MVSRDRVLILASKGGTVYRSTDRGVTWTLSYQATGTYNHLNFASSSGFHPRVGLSQMARSTRRLRAIDRHQPRVNPEEEAKSDG